MDINAHAFPVLGVDSLHYIPDFTRHMARISDGRNFTREELKRGEKVCIISQSLAVENGLWVGDTIDLRY